jgi:regulator of nonsense transcripts 2
LVKDIDGLTLTKYLEEIAAAVVEGACKGKGDPEAAVEIIVQLHTRLTPDFLPHLLPPLFAILSQAPAQQTGKEEKDREKEEKERLSKQRPVLRIVAELAVVGAWEAGSAKGSGEVLKALQKMVSARSRWRLTVR